LDSKRVRRLLETHPELQSTINDPMPNYGFGGHALFAAVQRTDRATIEVLLAAGADIRKRTTGGQADTVCSMNAIQAWSIFWSPVAQSWMRIRPPDSAFTAELCVNYSGSATTNARSNSAVKPSLRPMRIQDCATGDQKIDQAWIAFIEHTVFRLPTVGSLSDISACGQKHFDRGPIRSLDCGEQRVPAETVVWHRVIDCRLQLRVGLKEPAHALRIQVAHCGSKRLGRSALQRFNVRLQLCPRGKTVLLGQHLLGIREFALPRFAVHCLGLFSKGFEVGELR